MSYIIPKRIADGFNQGIGLFQAFRKVLSVAPARNGVYAIDMWYLVGDMPPPAKVTVSVAGTGHRLTDGETERNYVGTCVMSDGLVWHVFAEVVHE